MRKAKILVTGSSGMLGVDLCKELLLSCDVIGLDVSELPASGLRLAAFIKCDITDRDKTVNSIISAKPDLIIHAAAWTDVDGCEENPDRAKRINQEGTGNVTISAAELGIPLIYISTDFVFDGNKESPYTENDPPNPVNVYAKSKLEGERKTASLDKYLILRSGWLYGANGKNFVDTILEKVSRLRRDPVEIHREKLHTGKREKEIKVVDDQVGCPTYTKDFAKAIVRLIRWTMDAGRRTTGIYHISNKGKVSWFEYAKEILKTAKIGNVTLIPINSNQLDRPAKRPRFSVLDNSKFEKATNFVMRPWQEALREYVSERT